MVGAFDKILHEGYILTIPNTVLSFILHISIFIHFVQHGKICYDKYINTDDRKIYIDNDGSDIFLKQKDKKLYNEKYQEKYGNKRHVVSTAYLKDARICRVY